MRLKKSPRRLACYARPPYQRLLTLTEAGLIEQDEAVPLSAVDASLRCFAAALEQADLGTRVLPILQGLVHETKETASLAVLDRGQLASCRASDRQRACAPSRRSARRLPLEGSASGRILTAFADEATMRHLKESGLRTCLRRHHRRARLNGYALSSGYTQAGVRAIAAPIFDMQRQCTATLSLVCRETVSISNSSQERRSYARGR